MLSVTTLQLTPQLFSKLTPRLTLDCFSALVSTNTSTPLSEKNWNVYSTLASAIFSVIEHTEHIQWWFWNTNCYHLCTYHNLPSGGLTCTICNVCFFDSSATGIISDQQNHIAVTTLLWAMLLASFYRQRWARPYRSLKWCNTTLVLESLWWIVGFLPTVI